MGMSTQSKTLGKNSNSSSSNNNKNSSSNYITIGQYRINKERITMMKSNILDFLNPTEDFIGVVECLSNIRHIEKRGEMKQDLDVIDVRIIAGSETRTVVEEKEASDNSMIIRKETKEYHDEPYSLVLTKTVLLSKFKQLQNELQDLTGKKVVIVGLGKAEDKNYYDYYIATEEKAKEEGILQIVEKV